MSRGPALLVLFAFLLQTDPARLAEQLRSERVEEREEAARKLVGLGEAARPVLRKLSADPDSEVASRAAELLRTLDVAGKLPAGLRKAFPGIEGRLGRGDPHEWTRVFLDAIEKSAGRDGVATEDLDWLAVPALRGAAAGEERTQVAAVVFRRALKSAVPEMVSLFEKLNGEVGGHLTQALGRLDRAAAVAAFIHRLERPEGRDIAIDALVELQARQAAPAVARLLTDRDPQEVYKAVVALGLLGGRAWVPKILPLLASEEVRVAAAGALGNLGAREAVRPLLERLGDREPEVRAAAAQSLGILKATEAIPRLTALLADGNEFVQSSVLNALSQLDAFEAVAAVDVVLIKSAHDIRTSALYTAGKIRARGAIHGLVTCLEDGKDDVRELALETLVALECVEALPAVEKRIGDANAGVAARAVEAFGILGGSSKKAALLELLRHPKASVRSSAAETLADLDVKEAAPAIVPLLRDDDDNVRSTARRALEELGPASVVVPLLDLLKGGRGKACESAAMLLASAGAHEAVATLSDLMREENGPDAELESALEQLLESGPKETTFRLVEDKAAIIRALAVRALAARKEPEVLPRLRKALEDGDAAVRAAAARVLAERKDVEAVPALVARLDDADASVQAEAVGALVAMERREVIPRLRRLAGDERAEMGLRETAVNALGNLKAKEAVPELKALLGNLSSPLVSAAVRALAAQEAREALPDLKRLAEHDIDEIRLFVASALARFGEPEGLRALVRFTAHPEKWWRVFAVQALMKVGTPEAMGHAVRALTDQDRGFEHDLDYPLEDGQPPPPSAAILPFLKDSDPRLRAAALRTLELLRAKDAAPEVVLLLRDPEAGIRESAAGILQTLRPKGVAADLTPLLRDHDPEVRSSAAATLGALDIRPAIPGIVRLLEDPWPDVRRSALYALADFRATEAAEAVTARLADRSLEVRHAAMYAAGRVGVRDIAPLVRHLKERPVPSEAVVVLGILRAAEASDELLHLLGHHRRDMRRAAAEALCRIGRAEGVRLTLRNSGSFAVLNGVRRPDVWKRLHETRLTEDWEGSWMELLERLARAAGLALQVPPPDSDFQKGWRSQRQEIFSRGGRTTLADVLQELLPGILQPVLEPDRLILLPYEEAEAFWRKWAEEREKSK